MGGADTGASRRYAKALFNLAVERGEVDAITSSLLTVANSYENTPQLRTVLEHPRIGRDRKKEILAAAFKGQVSEDMTGFLLLLVEKDRSAIIPHVARDFAQLVDEYKREADAEAVTAVPMTEQQIATLRQRLEAQTGLKLRLTTRVDENILGGLIVRFGDKMIDDSAATKLDTLRERLRSVKVT
jgi:F-type H+-transporting ATPase subunit delta